MGHLDFGLFLHVKHLEMGRGYPLNRAHIFYQCSEKSYEQGEYNWPEGTWPMTLVTDLSHSFAHFQEKSTKILDIMRYNCLHPMKEKRGPYPTH